ncbi:MAG: ATP-binding protein [Gammaproteobacteria bacterium]|nr:ATP-binding protein [Gammaproteobacteria bacterium]MDA8007360.1 ATP-binding protein [Gammaproteobacteria bacterium]MDA8011147.1 ATP-binding protein [Gammaproteobacteria bacterium]
MRARRKISIRTKLSWLVLVLLIIPWMGYHYVREMRQFLLQGQQDALLLTANGIATVLNERSELFNPATGVPEVLGGENDLYAQPLEGPVQLDGRAGDWDALIPHATYHTGGAPFLCGADYAPDSFSLRHVIGHFENFLYAMFEVTDDQLIYRDLELLRLNTSDQIRILLQRRGEPLRHYAAVAGAPGRMSVYLVDSDWRLPLDGAPVDVFTAELAETEWGYRVELRIPRDAADADSRIGFFVVDVDDASDRKVGAVVSTSPHAPVDAPGQILLNSPELTKILKGLDQPRSLIWILDTQQRVRAVVGGISAPREPRADAPEAEFPQRLYGQIRRHIDALLRRPVERFADVPTDVTHRPEKIFTTILKGEPRVHARPSRDQKAQIISAGYPIRAGGEILGAVVVEQNSNVVLALQYRLLRSLTVVTILVFAFLLLALLFFAWRLTSRVKKLHSTTERAITAEGRVLEAHIPGRQYPGDELGDLGRSITSMLKRLSGYTRYLEGMPDTLAHEMNNPLNVVSSSLQILESDNPAMRGDQSMQRARAGVDRLRGILTSLTEAANLEEAMRNEDKQPLNLAMLVTEFVDGYRISQPDHRFQLLVGADPLRVVGSPDHLAQMLDKLIDNAVQFSLPDKTILVRVRRRGGNAEIVVLNEGKTLPENLRDRLFDPMVSHGRTSAAHSHLGLGLFVVRLITEYHNGQAWAENRTDMPGVAVTVSIPAADRS